MTKQKQTTKPDPNAQTITAPASGGDSEEKLKAELAMSPLVGCAMTATAFSKQFGELDLIESLAALTDGANKATAGDLNGAEQMLYGQAVALNAIFNDMARLASLNMKGSLNVIETTMRLAFKAQGQCRATLETLAEIKNPRQVAFVKQANIAHGHQQVNNGIAGDATHARENKNPPNELLTEEVQHGAALDEGRTGTASRANPQLETVGTRHRRKD